MPTDPAAAGAGGNQSPAPSQDQTSWAGIVAAIKQPLGFFALALLVAEAPFSVLFGLSGRSQFELELTIAVKAGLMVGLILIVTLLTVFFPKDLIEQAADAAALKVADQQQAQFKALDDTLQLR